MKRFTETNKWDDPWYRKLTPQAKHLLNYLRDKCDCAGVVEIDFESISFHVGEAIEEKHLSELESRLQRLPNGKVLMPKFISFQYGVLSEACPAHRAILKLVCVHGLERVGLDYRYPSATLALPIETSINVPISYPSARVQDKDKEKEKEKEWGVQGGIEKRSTIKNSTVIPECLNTPEFRAAWTMWLEHLKQKRKPPTLHAQDLQLRTLSSLGSAKAVTTIAYCIEHNWQGIYEPFKPDSHLKPNPRNAGIIKGPTNYATGKPRLQREREEREAAERAQKADVAEQVAQTHNYPSATGEP